MLYPATAAAVKTFLLLTVYHCSDPYQCLTCITISERAAAFIIVKKIFPVGERRFLLFTFNQPDWYWTRFEGLRGGFHKQISDF